MIKITKGPQADYEARFGEVGDVVDFRIVSDYHIQTDTILTRLDVKVDEEHWHNAVFTSVRLRQLKIPQVGVDGAWGAGANRQDLIEALRGLVDALEQGK